MTGIVTVSWKHQVGWDFTWANLLLKWGLRLDHSVFLSSWVLRISSERDFTLSLDSLFQCFTSRYLWAQLPSQFCVLFSRTCFLCTKDKVSTPCVSWQCPVSVDELWNPSSLLWSSAFDWLYLPIWTCFTWSGPSCSQGRLEFPGPSCSAALRLVEQDLSWHFCTGTGKTGPFYPGAPSFPHLCLFLLNENSAVLMCVSHIVWSWV